MSDIDPDVAQAHLRARARASENLLEYLSWPPCNRELSTAEQAYLAKAEEDQ